MEQPRINNPLIKETIQRKRSKTVLVNLEESRFLRKVKTMQLGEMKTVAWNFSTFNEKKFDYNELNQLQPDTCLNKKIEKKRKRTDDSNRKISCGLPRRKLVTIEGCLIEIIDAKGNISKKIMKSNKEEPKTNSEFAKTVIKKHSGEYSKAQSFFNENKEKEDMDDFIEDTVTNTMRNQFAGKMEVLDSGSAHSLLKKEK